MRLINRSAFGLLFASGVCVSVGAASVACSGDDFDGCEASRTCGSPETGGSAGLAGLGGAEASSGKGGTAGIGGKGGAAGSSGKGSAGKPGTGGSSSHEDAGAGGSDDAHDSGGTHNASGGSHADGGTAGAHGNDDDDSGSGGSDEGGAGDNGTGGTQSQPPADTTPPTIESTAPSAFATGVTADARIYVTFSEDMDSDSTLAAYSSTDLPADAVDLFVQGSVLTIIPKEPLVYADVLDPGAPAKTYTINIGPTAEDTAGNQLGDAVQKLTFSTLRHIKHTLWIPSGGGVEITHADGGASELEPRCVDDDDLTVGDSEDNEELTALVSFDIRTIPDGVTEWTSARISADLKLTATNPYGASNLGHMHYFSTVVDPATVGPSSMVTDLGDFASSVQHVHADHDVRAALSDDYEHRATRAKRSQYLFRFETPTNDDGIGSAAKMRCSHMQLNLEYYAP